MTPAHRELLQEFQTLSQTASTAETLMEAMAKHLHEKMTRYNWTGFYLVDPADSNFLIVGPYAGSFTPNARFVNKKLAAELDIESYFADTFTKAEQDFIESSATLVAKFLSKG
ncbi:MAG: hypothetical protein WBE13_09075 [Candidatus Acidiferrum sp.]